MQSSKSLSMFSTLMLFALSLYGCSESDFSGVGSAAGGKSNKEKKIEEDEKENKKGLDEEDPEEKKDKEEGDEKDEDPVTSDSDIADLVKDEDGEVVIDETKLRALCETKAKTYDTTLSFPANTGDQCEWGKDGNLPGGNGSAGDIRAVRRFLKPLKIPTKNKYVFLCDFGISTENKFTVFDDDIVITLNDWIIASDYLSESFYTTRKLEKTGELFKYDFKKIVGAKWPTAKDYLGPGVTGELDTRQNSQSQREGKVNVTLSKGFLEAMPKKEMVAAEHEFGFSIHGNRMQDADCQHSGFDFKVDVKYLD